MATVYVEKPEKPDPGVHALINANRAGYLCADEQIKRYRDYAEGRHSLQLTEDQRKILAGLLENKRCENLARKIIAEARDRLRFEEWKCSNAAVADWLAGIYKKARLQDRQGKIHFDTLRDGDHGIAVNWDNAKKSVRVYREPWWDGTEGLFIGYDATDEATYAVKDWRVILPEGGEAIRRIIWWDDRFERWISTDGGSSWEPYILPDDNGVWPQPWVKIDGTPLHIPIVHFKNTGQGEDVYGASELAGGVLGLIDDVQDIHYCLSGSARLNGFPIITIAGVQLRPKAGGKPGETEEPKAGPGMILHSPSPDTKYGILQPGDPAGLIAIRREKLQAISVMTQTPVHSITGGDWPSGEALLRAEQPAAGKATTQRDTFETAWSTVGHRAVEIQNRFGAGPQLTEDVDTALIEARFADVERRDPLSQSIVVSNLGARISDREALRRMGYSKEEADTITDEKDAETKAAVESQQLLFSRGVGGRGTALPGKGEPGGNGAVPGAGAGAGNAGGGAGEGGSNGSGGGGSSQGGGNSK
jgi:hypothetical protein